MEQLIFGGAENQRFTQDSPILPEVWLKYALHPDKARDLILIPNRTSNAGAFANDLNDRLAAYKRYLPTSLRKVDLRDGREKRARIAHLPGVVAARLYVDEFLRLVLPATPWWQKMVNRYRDKLEDLEKDGKLKSPYRQFGDPTEPLNLKEGAQWQDKQDLIGEKTRRRHGCGRSTVAGIDQLDAGLQQAARRLRTDRTHRRHDRHAVPGS